MSTWIPPVPEGATTIYDPEAGIGSLTDIKAGDIVIAGCQDRLPPVLTQCYAHPSTGALCADGLTFDPEWGVTILRAFRLASVPLPTEGGPYAIRATVRGVERVLIFGPDEGSDWYSFDPIGRDCWHRPEDIVWDGQAYVGPGEQNSEADR